MTAIHEIYARALGLARSTPALLLLAFSAELLQHIAEMRLGMFAQAGQLTPEAMRIRLLFGAVKVLALVLTLLFALRYWRFEGDRRRAARPTAAMFKGIGIFILVGLGGETITLLAGRLLLAAAPHATTGYRIALVAAPALLWLFFANLLLPWFVGLLTEDRAMTLRRSVRGSWGHLWSSFAILVAGFLPLMIVHYALGYGALRRPVSALWPILIVDACVVAGLILALSSTYFTLYRRAAERAPE
jgi:hypothetical protein